MAILGFVPGKPKMCLQENLVDCADCGGLDLPTSKVVVQTFFLKKYGSEIPYLPMIWTL